MVDRSPHVEQGSQVRMQLRCMSEVGSGHLMFSVAPDSALKSHCRRGHHPGVSSGRLKLMERAADG